MPVFIIVSAKITNAITMAVGTNAHHAPEVGASNCCAQFIIVPSEIVL